MRLSTLLALALLGACSSSGGPGEVPESMAKRQPSAGLAQLRLLFAEGYVRAATQAEIDAYRAIAQHNLPAGSPPLNLSSLTPDSTLILIRPFRVTPQMGMMQARSIIVPVGVGKNDDPNPLFGYYYLETGRCNVPGSNCLGAPKMDAAWHARARRLSGVEPDRAVLSESERNDSGWAETSKSPEPRNRPDGPLGQLPLD